MPFGLLISLESFEKNLQKLTPIETVIPSSFCISAEILCAISSPEPKSRAAGHIEPALVNAKRLDEVGVSQIYLSREDRKLAVFIHMRRHADELRANRARLPDGLRGFHARLFGELIFREHYSVPVALTAADCHRHIAQFGSEGTLHRGKKVIEIAVQNNPVAHRCSPSLIRTFVQTYYISFLCFRQE